MNIPLEPSLFFASSFFVALVLSELINHNEKKNFFSADVFLPILIGTGLISIALVFILASNNVELAKALSPTLIVISAFIASASVMKSINAQKKLEQDRNDRLQKRNKSILIINLESLLKEINGQLEYLTNTPIDELYNYKYSDNLNDKLIFREVEKITGLEINEYNSHETIKEIDNIKKEVFTRIHSFEILFKKLVQIDSNELDNTLKSLIKRSVDYYFKTTTTIDDENIQEAIVNTCEAVYHSETSTGLEHTTQDNVESLWKLIFETRTIVQALKKDLREDHTTIAQLIEKLKYD